MASTADDPWEGANYYGWLKDLKQSDWMLAEAGGPKNAMSIGRQNTRSTTTTTTASTTTRLSAMEGKVAEQSGKPALAARSNEGNYLTATASDQAQYLVLEVYLCEEKDPVLATLYHTMVLIAHTIPANNNHPLPQWQVAERRLILHVLHSDGWTRQVHLQSNCTDRISHKPLDESWPIDPSWSLVPIQLDSPVNIWNGRGHVTVCVDSEHVISAEFNQDDEEFWSVTIADGTHTFEMATMEPLADNSSSSSSSSSSSNSTMWRSIPLMPPFQLLTSITSLQGVVHTTLEIVVEDLQNRQDPSLLGVLIEAMSVIGFISQTDKVSLDADIVQCSTPANEVHFVFKYANLLSLVLGWMHRDWDLIFY